MKTSTLLVLLGISIIGVSLVTFASFILTNGATSPYFAPAGSILSVAVLTGLGQILVGRALRPNGPSLEEEKSARKDKSRAEKLMGIKSKGRLEEEPPRVIAVDDQEPATWLKTTLDRLAEQGVEPAEESITPAELPSDIFASSKPKMEERPKSFPPRQSPPPIETVPPAPKREPFGQAKKPASSRFEAEQEGRVALPGFGRPPEASHAEEEEEEKPGVRRLKEMEITFVERDGITFLEAGTGIHERYPCEDQSLIDFAWRALVRGQKVNVEVASGKVTKITPSG